MASIRGQIRELDGLRGVAIALVLLHHFWPKAGPLESVSSVVHLGWIGVDLFFVISGFLITGILLDTKNDPNYYRNFYARRSLRIFPLYYGFLLAAFTVIPLVQRGPYFSTEFLQESGSPLWYLFYCGNLREAILGHEPAYILAPLWSLSIEEQFYLTFPIIVACCSHRQLATLLVGCVVLAPVWRAAMLGIFPDNERIQYLATLSRMDVICWGGLLAIAVRSGGILPVRWTNTLLPISVMAVVAAFHLNGLDRNLPFCRVFGYSLIGLTFALVVLWAIQNRETWQTTWLRSRPLCNLGVLCYGTYLLQRPSEIILTKTLDRLGAFNNDPDSVELLVLKCAFAITLAWISWRCFERPILSLKSRFHSTHHPAHSGQVPGYSADLSRGTSPTSSSAVTRNGPELQVGR